MLHSFRATVRRAIRATGYDIVPATPALQFHSDAYTRHNARRLEHLASLRIPVAGKSVLEVGAGIGDHSTYYLDRGCRVTITEARPDSLKYLRSRFPNGNIHCLDMEFPADLPSAPFDLVHCYGLLYHLKNPAQAIKYFSRNTKEMLLLETCVSVGEKEGENVVNEVQADPTQAWSGIGCRPTRSWIFARLRAEFQYVYIPKTQPNHDEFPVNWSAPELHKGPFSRAVFIASRQSLDNPLLADSLMTQQTRHE
jgi:2-polyprenyl-3-methyl-5-hydroxy-6-metoxy-1,4-benzoquinol methylase